MLPAILAPEARVLVHALTEAPAARIAAEIDDPAFDWTRLVVLAQKEKAMASLWGALRGLPETSLPAERAAQLQRMSAISDFRMLHLEQLLVRSLAALREAGVEALLLKGAGMAVTVYGSFAARPMYDLDLLVRPDQAEAAWDALREMGWKHDEEEIPADFYEEHHHLPPLDDPAGTGLSLELHTAPWAGAVALSSEEMWAAARPVEIGGQGAWVPSVEHQILHLATHFVWAHMLRSAGWRTMRDLAQILATSEVDWAALTRLARETRGVTCCYWTFVLGRSLAGLTIPEEVVEELRPPLPGVVLHVLKRHYLGVLFQFSPVRCPSLRVEKALWSAGMAPGWSGHGDDRPWKRDVEWAALTGAPPSQSLGERLRAHAQGISNWAGYARGLLVPQRHA